MRRPAVLAGEKIEKAAAGLDDSDAGKPVQIARNETLLQRYAETNPENIGPGRGDIREDRLFLGPAEITVAPPGKDEARIKSLHFLDRRTVHLFGAAEEIKPAARLFGALRHRMDEISRRDPFPQCPGAEFAGEDHQRHAIGVDLVRLPQHGVEFPIVMAERNDLAVRRRRIKRPCTGGARRRRTQDEIPRRFIDGRVSDGQRRKRNNRPDLTSPLRIRHLSPCHDLSGVQYRHRFIVIFTLMHRV
ncbi:hypothetical protein D3C86_1268960 [compost metagenome]